MLQVVAEAHSIDQHDLHVTTSIGVSVYPDDGLDAETLIKNADTAMYQAKENGRQSYRFFKPAMNVRAVERQSIEESLRRALEDTTIVTAVIAMARSLKLRVVAEGVETVGELTFLRAHQCDEAQGYYFSRPVPPQQFARLLKTGIAGTGDILRPDANSAPATAELHNARRGTAASR